MFMAFPLVGICFSETIGLFVGFVSVTIFVIVILYFSQRGLATLEEISSGCLDGSNCIVCGYDTADSPSSICSECGAEKLIISFEEED